MIINVTSVILIVKHHQMDVNVVVAMKDIISKIINVYNVIQNV